MEGGGGDIQGVSPGMGVSFRQGVVAGLLFGILLPLPELNPALSVPCVTRRPVIQRLAYLVRGLVLATLSFDAEALAQVWLDVVPQAVFEASLV